MVDEVTDEGQLSYRITTPAATWVFHPTGGGFSSLLDPDGNDWINFRPEGGPAGHYRGIPNAVFNLDVSKDNYFHPGHSGERGSTTSLAVSGKKRVVLRTESGNGRWSSEWEILPDRAIFTMMQVPDESPNAYWVLYEGTPGGQFNPEDRCLRSDGTISPLSEKWEGSMEDLSWVAFISQSTKRSLILISHDTVDQPLSYWPMKDSMTVFGFGRALGPPIGQLTKPMSFTVALLEESDPERIAALAAKLQN